MRDWHKKAFILIIAVSVCLMIPVPGSFQAEIPTHDPGPGIALNKGTDHDSLWQVSNAWGGEAYAKNSRIGGTLQQGAHIGLIPRKNSQGPLPDGPSVTPKLGSFILIGCGLLTLAGWGKRKLRR